MMWRKTYPEKVGTGVFPGLFLVLAIGLLNPVAAQSTAQSKIDKAAILTINSEFYRAFRESDEPGMDAVWAQEGSVSLQHPSGWRVDGREAVMESWSLILQRPPRITCVVEGISFAEKLATVFCNEQLNPGNVRMKNIFQREGGVWKMIYHGPLSEDEAVS
ncbi:nuclear transport factor 2 family protein [Pelagibius sp. Alg239-R121]|uniref:nuclear transport factor 2 family protein n=1 Tax=Pelagibius sp. Alg239-R121 TaxID=2993448 RepID=UPI0024A654A7|nr:nuclear transport factor 2 family protein [Pelagibius sp. Alg239-R121]